MSSLRSDWLVSLWCHRIVGHCFRRDPCGRKGDKSKNKLASLGLRWKSLLICGSNLPLLLFSLRFLAKAANARSTSASNSRVRSASLRSWAQPCWFYRVTRGFQRAVVKNRSDRKHHYSRSGVSTSRRSYIRHGLKGYHRANNEIGFFLEQYQKNCQCKKRCPCNAAERDIPWLRQTNR